MLIQITEHPYYWTDGDDIYSFRKKFKKLNGWRLTYLGRLRYSIKADRRGTENNKYFYKDDLKKYL